MLDVLLAHKPTIDNLCLSLRYNAGFSGMKNKDAYFSRLNKQFDNLCKVIADDVGSNLQTIYKDGKERVYVPGYGIYLTTPDAKWGYGQIYLRPTVERLVNLQRWLKTAFNNLNGLLSLKFIELSYDFTCDNLDLPDYDALVLRVGQALMPRNGINLYSAAIIGSQKRTNDRAINGSITVYVQSCKRKGSSRSSDDLNRNLQAAGHTKIYGKSICAISFLRVEHTLDAHKAKRCNIKFDVDNLPAIMDLPDLPFSKFYEFKQVDVEKLIAHMQPQDNESIGKKARRKAWIKSLQDVKNSQVADKIRFIRGAAKGNKELRKAAKNVVKKISFMKAINTPLPDDFWISQRMGRHKLPDDSDLPDVIELVPYTQPEPNQPPAPPRLPEPPEQMTLPGVDEWQNMPEKCVQEAFTSIFSDFAYKARESTQLRPDGRYARFSDMAGAARASP